MVVCPIVVVVQPAVCGASAWELLRRLRPTRTVPNLMDAARPTMDLVKIFHLALNRHIE